MPKGIYVRTYSPPKKQYPSELVAQVAEMYAAGMTIREIQDEVPGVKVQRLIENHGIPTRPAAKRDQRGPKNHMWRGSTAKLAALHLRVEAARGKPRLCEWCGQSDPAVRYEWANLSGRYDDVTDFARLCVPCHRPYDAHRRRVTGVPTSAGWVR